jgi:hypothetical protein
MSETNTINKSNLKTNGNKKDTMDKRDLARLLDYYRMRVGKLILIAESFERERIDWLEKLEGLKISQDEYHRTEWELRRRTDEIIELQNALSDCNISLNQERKHAINLTNELENARCNFNLSLSSKD